MWKNKTWLVLLDLFIWAVTVSFEFSLNDFRWIQWIVPKPKSRMVTRDPPRLAIDTFPNKAAKMIFHYIWVGIYSVWLVCGNRYLPRGSKRKCIFYYYCWQRICFQIGITVVNISFLGNLTHMPLPGVDKATHSGFEIQSRHHQKSKTEVSVAQQKGSCPPIFLKKKGGWFCHDSLNSIKLI